MALRGKKPKERSSRLKALVFSPAGIGKTYAAIQMPKPYLIDTENGAVHYGDMIEAKGGAVFESNNMDDVIQEVRSLATETHPYQTLIIDPFTAPYDNLLDEGEAKVGSDFGRHYGYANKACKRLFNLLTMLDMNVIVTAHAKNMYGDNLKVEGVTFDGWKKLDYLFDLVFELQRRGPKKEAKRYAIVRKTRLADAFPDQDEFEWSYDALAGRYGREKLEAGVTTVELASPEQVREFNQLLSQLTEADMKRLKIDKVLKDVEDVSDLPAERIAKGIEVINNYITVGGAA